MIVSGPRASSSNAPAVEPNAFDISPNILRPGTAWVTELSCSKFEVVVLLSAQCQAVEGDDGKERG